MPVLTAHRMSLVKAWDIKTAPGGFVISMLNPGITSKGNAGAIVMWKSGSGIYRISGRPRIRFCGSARDS